MSQQIEAFSTEVEPHGTAADRGLNLTVEAGATDATAHGKIGPLGENLIFLISQPRSGSTLLQRILAGHEEVFATAEPWIMLHLMHALKRSGYAADYNAEWASNALADFCENLPGGENDYVAALRGMAVNLYNKALEGTGKTHFIDKTPRYYCICPELRRTFPAARFVFLTRNPLAVLASIIQSWTKEDWKKMELFRRDLLEAPGLLAAAINDFGSDALVVHYEELAADPEGVVGRLCAALGLKFQSEMLDYGSRAKPRGKMGDQIGVDAHQQTVTSSVAKWRQTLATPEAKFFAFRYAAALSPEVLSGLGYPTETLLGNVVSIPGAPLGAGLTHDWLQWTNEFFGAAPAVPAPRPIQAGDQPIAPPIQKPVQELTAFKAVPAGNRLEETKTSNGELSGVARTLKEMAEKRLARGDAAGARQVLTKALQSSPGHQDLLAVMGAIDVQSREKESVAAPKSSAVSAVNGSAAAQRLFNGQAQGKKATRPSRAELLKRYQAMFERVEGWLHWEAIEILNFLNDAQMEEGVTGNFAEIGAYQGKLTLGMATFLNPDKEALIVNDIFDNQDLNTSRSGVGATLAAFRRNLTELDADPHYLRIIMKRSDEVRPSELGTGIRFFSVDGGHSMEETRDDMRLAAQTLHDQGMIVLDDFFNTNWPGVEAGVKAYFEQHADLAPLLAFYNKFVFVKRESLAWFQRLLEARGFEAFCRDNNWMSLRRSLHGFDYTFVPKRAPGAPSKPNGNGAAAAVALAADASPQAILTQASALASRAGKLDYSELKPHYPAFEESLDAWITPRLGFSMAPNPYGQIFPLVERRFEGWLDAMRQHAVEVMPFIKAPQLSAIPDQKVDEITPYWRNDYFHPGDARLAYAMVARHRPARIIECGCGNSTKFMRRAATDFETETRILCIDPQPRADIRGVADEFHQASAASVDPAYFGQLQPGDFLFIDGSHLLMNGSDCTHLFLNVLPRLKPGVWVHIHDVFLPHDYPYELHVACRYNEQYALAMLFLYSDDWLPALPIYYAHRKQILPQGGGSLWMKRVK